MLVPAASVDDDLAVPGGCSLVPWRTADDIVRAVYGEFDAAVLMSDGLEGRDMDAVITAVRASSKPVVEVRSEQWDGSSPMPLAAACKGIITGFGLAGAWTAAQALRG